MTDHTAHLYTAYHLCLRDALHLYLVGAVLTSLDAYPLAALALRAAVEEFETAQIIRPALLARATGSEATR